jgi:hypothetical protein
MGGPKGIQVQSPQGAQYEGVHVTGSTGDAYIMDKRGEPVVIIVYAADPSGRDLARRLAGNVGNGNGLNDDPQVASSLNAMAPPLPQETGLRLTSMQAYSSDSLQGSLSAVNDSLNTTLGGGAQQVMNQARSFVPPSLTVSTYVDNANREFTMMTGDYEGSIKAWSIWQVAQRALAGSNARTISITGSDAVMSEDSSGQYILFRHGTLIGAARGPDSRVIKLVEAMNQTERRVDHP